MERVLVALLVVLGERRAQVPGRFLTVNNALKDRPDLLPLADGYQHLKLAR